MAEIRFRAMGTDCHVLVTASDGLDDALAALARERIEILEQCWSRFRPDSELSVLNATAGRGPRPVSADLLLLVERMHEAWRLSDGLFDPTILESLRLLGYDADFATVTSRATPSAYDIPATPAPGMSGVAIDRRHSAIALPDGVGIDPGAIGKGLAADIVAEELAAAGASAVLVNLGGDLSVAGQMDGPWVIGIEDERLPSDHAERILRLLEFPPGTERFGVTTSTTLKRRWAQGRRHHVIDPRTGSMSVGDLRQVTVVGTRAWEAEVLATTALLMPSMQAREWLAARDVTAFLLTDDQILHTDMERAHG